MNCRRDYRGAPDAPPPAEECGFGSGILCEDPQCFRHRPHHPREYGCRWNRFAIVNRDGSVTKLDLPKE